MVLCLLSSAGCPTVDLGDVPPDPGQCRPDPGYFRDVIWGGYLAPADEMRSCVSQAGCHRTGDGRSALRLSVPPAGMPDAVDHDANYAVVTRFLNCGSPAASSLLSKPIGGVDPHGGGDMFAAGSEPETLFLQWFGP